MPGYNSVTFIGNLTKDPRLAYLPRDQTPVCDFTIAINEKRKGKVETLFMDVTAWNNQAEACGKFIKKGSMVLVRGRLVKEEWTNRETKQQNSRMKVMAETVQFLDKRQKEEPEEAAEPEAAAEEPTDW